MRKDQLLKPVLILIFTLGVLFLTMEIFRSPGKSGKPKIDGADGKKLKLKSDKRKKLKFDADTRGFEEEQ